MLPPWMIAELEKEKADREAARRPELRIEIPRAPLGWEPKKKEEPATTPRGVCRIEFLEAA